MSKTLKDEIIAQVEHLDDPQRQRVLDFARQLTEPAGTPGRNLVQFAGSIDRTDLEAMSQAIQQGCEEIEPNGW